MAHVDLFISDLHFSHKKIIEFERTQFKSIEHHDNFLIKKHQDWLERILHFQKNGHDITIYNLGDFGSLKYLYLWSQFPCEKVFLYGNHDKHKDREQFEAVFDKVYLYPFYLTDRIIVSHEPQAVWGSQINVHGHLHGSIIDLPNYITCSCNDRHYNLVSSFKFGKTFSKLPEHCYKFLREPWRSMEKIINRPQNDMVLLPNGHTNVPATIELLGDKFKW